MVFGSSGRQSALVSHADSRAAIGDDQPREHGSPLKTLKRMGGKLKHHTAVTTTEEEPGVSSNDEAAGTAVPVAERAKKGSLNAGFQSDEASTRGGRRSFSSFRSFRGSGKKSSKDGPATPQSNASARNTLPGSPGSAAPDAAGQSGGSQDLNPEQAEALNVAHNPQNYLNKAGKDDSAQNQEMGKSGHRGRKPRLANTETTFQDSEEQGERERRVREHLQNTQPPKHKHPAEIDSSDDSGSAQAGADRQGESKQASSEAGSAQPYGALNGAAPGNPAHFDSSSEYVDAPDPSTLGRTRSQPSPEAVGSLSPRNRFVGHGSRQDGQGIHAVASGDSDGFADAPETRFNTPMAEAPSGYATPRNGSIANGVQSSGGFLATGGPQANGGPRISSESKRVSTHDSSNGGTDSTIYEGSEKGANGATGPDRANGAQEPNGPNGAHGAGAHGAGAHGANGSTPDENAATRADSTHASGGEPQSKQRVEHDDEISEDEYDSEGGGFGPHPDEQEDEVNVPPGSVPGLGVGDFDPKLPGERTRKKKPKKTSDDLETEKAKQRFTAHEEEIRIKRERQAEFAGWRQIGGWDKRVHENSREESENLLQRATLLETYINDKYLGDWYQNTVIIVFTAFFSWVLGRMHMSMSWISIVLVFTATAYRTSVRRMRRNYRDDLLRESMLEGQEGNDGKDTESMEWLNSFLIKFWLIYEPSLSQMITEIGNEVLAEQTPGFIHSMKIDKFTLGTKAPRIDFVRSFPRTNPLVVVIDMGASFTPNDTMDLTARQLQTKVNPKVQLGVRIGKGFLTKHFPILLEDMNFKGSFRLRMRLMERAPHIQTVDFSFLSPPSFDFVLKPIGGDRLGFDINIIPGLSKFIKDMVNANLGPMLYAPNAFQINVEQLLAGVGAMSGVGVLSIEILSAENLKRDADGRVDPYVMVYSKDKKELAHTKIKTNTTEPVWNESVNVIVTNTNDNVLLEVFDFDESAPDRSVGSTPLKISNLQSSEVNRVPITSGGTRTGFLTYVAHYSPVTMPTEDDHENGSSPRDTKSGILSLKIGAARDLDPTISKTASLSPFAEILFSARLVDSTKVAKDTNDPEWNYSAEHIVMDKVSALFQVVVRDNRGRKVKSPQVAVFKMRLSQLLIESEKGRKWFDLEDGKGEIKIEPQWKPANITVGGSTNNYVEPVGVLRVKIKNAKNLRNLEHLGKIDPYARVFIGNRLVARTDWFKNELNPVWNETLYLPVQSELQDMTIEVMDVENHAKDRSLGAFKVQLQNIIQRDENDNCKVFISDKTFTNKLMLPNRGPKGTLEYTMEFYPAVPIVSPAERERLVNDRKVIAMLKKKIAENGGTAEKALTEEEGHELAIREEHLDIGGVDMPVEEQLKYEAGVFAVSIVTLEGHRVGQSLKIIANNDPYAIFTSPAFKNTKRYSSEECPDFVSGQINLSSLRFELGTFSSKSGVSGLVDADDGEDEKSVAKDPHAAEITVPCRELIAEATVYPKMYEMKNGAKIQLQARFFPLPGLVIEPDEDISHKGCIEIDLQKAVGVAAADRTGLSDPYCAFYMNNENDKVYKSKIQKATLDPVWNEQFRFAVADYKNSFVKAIVNDWDMGNRDDFLGGYKFSFDELEPLEWKDYTVPLEKIKKHREVKTHRETEGELSLRIRFLPGHVEKDGDRYVTGAASVSRLAGGMSGGAAGAAGIVGAAAHGPHVLFNKITHHGNDGQEDGDAAMTFYNVQVESISGVDTKHDVQVRFFLLGGNERELYRSGSLKVENGETTPNAEFSFKSYPDSELGIKVLAVKSLGRHSDIAQSSTDLSPGFKEIRLTKDAVLRISVAAEDNNNEEGN